MEALRQSARASWLLTLLCLYAAGAASGQTRPATASVPATQATPPASAPATRPASAPARGGEALKRAQELFMKGQYAPSAEQARSAMADPTAAAGASVLLARALDAQGQYAQALASLEQTKAAGAPQSDWHLARSEALALVGRYDEALAAANEARRLAQTWAPAILAHGELLELLGRKKDALAIYLTMERTVEDASYRNDPRTLVALGRILERLAVLAGRRASQQAANILDNYLKRASDEVDKTYWPAHVAAGEFLLAKHRSADAAKYFQRALQLNGQIPDAMVGLGAIALEDWQFETCMQMADRALGVNPVHAGALVLKASCLMQWRKFTQVAPVLDKALAVNANDVQALSLMAAMYVRRYMPDKARPFEQRVAKINPACELLPLTIGGWLSGARQYDQAADYLKKAVELAPESAAGWTELSLTYMQAGQETLARDALEKAYALDDFRADVVNYLNLLKRMEKFLAKETAHFIVRVDGERDEVLLDQVSAYMESIYPTVCSEHGYEPKSKTIIEIFPTDLQFGLRITGRGWIGTVGACTGGVIAMVAPAKEGTNYGTHNWAAVLRHEYTHTVTLEATRNRIPHWLTEACAVRQQPDRRSYDALRALAAATTHDKLVPVRELDWAFQRPKKMGDRELAYAQSEWMLEYLIETRGFGVLSKMLAGFRDGKTQAEVFQEALGTTESKLDADFKEWAQRSVRTWGLPVERPVPLEKAQQAAGANPKDPAAQADLAQAWFVRGRQDQETAQAAEKAGQRDAAAAIRHRAQESLQKAQAAARAALKLQPAHVKALGVLAQALAADKKYDEALEAAHALEKADADSLIAPRVVAVCALRTRQPADAVHALELLKLRTPMDPFSYTELAKIYIQLGEPAKALPNLIELHRRSLHSGVYARQVANISRSLGQDDQALEFYRQITYIDPYEVSAYEGMASIHRDAGRFDQAVVALQAVCLLQPNSADAWTKMAMMRYQAGRTRKDKAELARANEAADKALKIDPECQAKTVKEYVQAALDELPPAK
ncbi:MAG: tetratricopeptide repeat protein [Planctomycetota bacterium]|nr:tetratricopeptide repeat protein [Planctomycetota bacterium]